MSEDIEALVERLRVAKNTTLGVGLLWHLCGTAADALTALAAERDALAAEVARLREAMQAAYDDWASHSDSSVGLILRHALATPAPDALAALLRAERNRALEEAAREAEPKRPRRRAAYAHLEDAAGAAHDEAVAIAAAIRAMKEDEA